MGSLIFHLRFVKGCLGFTCYGEMHTTAVCNFFAKVLFIFELVCGIFGNVLMIEIDTITFLYYAK